jgi:hypothetical protein
MTQTRAPRHADCHATCHGSSRASHVAALVYIDAERRDFAAAGVVGCSGVSFTVPVCFPRGRRVAALRLPRLARARVGCPESCGVSTSSETTAAPVPAAALGAGAAPTGIPVDIPSGTPSFIPRCLIANVCRRRCQALAP